MVPRGVSYSLARENVGLLAPLLYPQPRAMLCTSVVFPEPSSPTSATTSPGFSCRANRRPQARISAGLLNSKVLVAITFECLTFSTRNDLADANDFRNPALHLIP